MERSSRRRSSDHRNMLYNEPSMVGPLIVVGIILTVVAIGLAVFLL